jgi:hypothetical protein
VEKPEVKKGENTEETKEEKTEENSKEDKKSEPVGEVWAKLAEKLPS